MTDPTYTPTIEQVAEALGEPYAYLMPRRFWTGCGTKGSPFALRVQWEICVDPDLRSATGALSGGRAIDFTGPTRADALRAAWAYITSQKEKNK